MSDNHWMMFATFAQQGHFVYPSPDAYFGVIINGNMAAYAPNGLSKFVLTRTKRQRYIIDPQTHAFQHDPYFVKSGDRVKKSVERLTEAYGDPMSELVGKRPLTPSMLRDSSLLREFVSRVLEFQRTCLATRMEGSDDFKYTQFEQTESGALEPYALVAPYFYMQEPTIDQWIVVNKRAAQIARDLASGTRLFSAIVISQGVLLSSTHRQRIVKEFADIDLDGFLIWVDDLDEGSAGGAELKNLVDLARNLRLSSTKPRETINLHAGYFSTLATSPAVLDQPFTAACHGPEFGEFRSIVPVGGGIPVAKYYVPQLHQRVRYREALGVFRELGYLENAELFHESVCDCPDCRETLNGNASRFVLFGEANPKEVRRGSSMVRIDYPTPEAANRCLQHYLQRKRKEFEFAETATLADIVADLETGATQYQDTIGIDGVAHLRVWRSVLEGTYKE